MSADGAGIEIDFEAEGLLEGVEGEAREARLALLEQLAAEGVHAGGAARSGRRRPADAAAGRAGAGRRPARATRAREIAEIAGSTSTCCSASAPPSAFPTPTPTSARCTEADLEAARRMKAFLDAGLPEDGMLQVARTIGMGTARIAEANRELIDPHPDAAGRHRARPRPALRRRRRVHAAAGRADPRLRAAGAHCWSRSAAT